MNDIEKIDDIPSTKSLSKTGVRAIGFAAAGIFVLILNAVSQSFLPGLIVGSVVSLIGIGSFRSKDPVDRKAGVLVTAAGAATIVSKTGIPLLAPLSNVLLGFGAFALLALGVFNGIRFFIGLKKRS